MSDNPHKAPEDGEAWRVKLTSKPSPFDLSTALWMVAGAISVVPIVLSLVAGDMETDARIAMCSVGAVLLLSCMIGLKLNWGPVIPCMFFFPMCCGMLPTLNSEHTNLIGMFLAHVFLGGILGFVLEAFDNRWARKRRRRSDTQPG